MLSDLGGVCPRAWKLIHDVVVAVRALVNMCQLAHPALARGEVQRRALVVVGTVDDRHVTLQQQLLEFIKLALTEEWRPGQRRRTKMAIGCTLFLGRRLDAGTPLA